MPEQVKVALALIRRNGRWLVSRRAPGRVFEGLWEFPGGKVAAGETPAEAAVREALEEVGLVVMAEGELPSVTTHHQDRDVILHLVLCRMVAGEARVTDEAVAEVRWVTREELSCLPMPPANEQIVRLLLQAVP